MPMISAHNLHKEFRRPKRIDGPLGGIRTMFTRETETSRAVDDVSFTIDEGELVGYLGSNGAGKSTTIKMLAGILVPSSGTATVSGLVPWQDRSRNALNIGVVFGQRTQLWWDLPLIDSMRIIAKLYAVDDDRLRHNLDRLTDQLDLGSFLNTPVRQLSLGQRMRGDLAACMLYEPRVMFLDEPTVGLDVVARERMRQFVEETNRETGTTIMLTTHDLADVERLCQRIIFIDKGRVLFDGRIAELKRRYAPYRDVRFTMEHDDAAARVQSMPDIETVMIDGAQVTIRANEETSSVASVISAVMAGGAVVDLAILEPDLEHVVREIEESGEVRA